jgi:hypothetical protein
LHQNPYAPVPFTHGADAAFTAGAVFMGVALVVALTLIQVRPGQGAQTPTAAVG